MGQTDLKPKSPMRLSSEQLKKIKHSNNILDIISEHVVLRKSGANHTGLCPFHSERSPSFSVSETKQVFHCYGCKIGGDVVTFLKELHGISFMEAVRELVDRSGLKFDMGDLEGASEKDRARRKEVETAQRLNRFVASFFRSQLALPAHASAKQYLKERQLSSDIERQFYVGFAEDRWDGLSKFLVQKKAPITLATQLGFVRESTKNRGETMDLFRNRVMFPILDTRGKVIGFGGRQLPGESKTGEGPKYLNSPDSILFQKGRVAFGLYQARKFIREQDEIIIVEGYFDVMALHQVGIQNVVATCGTALTEDHLQHFARMCSKITVLFDGDEAGINATERSMELGLKLGLALHGVTLPLNEDPDTFVLKGGAKAVEELKTRISNSQPLIDTRIDEWIQKGLQNSEAKSQGIKKLGAWLREFKDPVGREVRLQMVEQRLGISRQLLVGTSGPQQADRSSTPQIQQSGSGLQQRASAPQVNTQSSQRSQAQRTPQKKPLNRREQLAYLESEFIWLSVVTFYYGNEEAEKPEMKAELGEFFLEVSKLLPVNANISDLFEQDLAKDLTKQLIGGAKKGQLGLMVQSLQSSSEADSQRVNSTDFHNRDLKSQMLSVVTEALMSEKLPHDPERIKSAAMHLLKRLWARFSQEMRAALASAESNKDNDLQSKLMKEYLDVQRKIKELNNFYDKI